MAVFCVDHSMERGRDTNKPLRGRRPLRRCQARHRRAPDLRGARELVLSLLASVALTRKPVLREHDPHGAQGGARGACHRSNRGIPGLAGGNLDKLAEKLLGAGVRVPQSRKHALGTGRIAHDLIERGRSPGLEGVEDLTREELAVRKVGAAHPLVEDCVHELALREQVVCLVQTVSVYLPGGWVVLGAISVLLTMVLGSAGSSKSMPTTL